MPALVATQDAAGELPETSGRLRGLARVVLEALPDLDAPVVVCSELPNNPGGSITNSAKVIAAGVIRANELPTPLVWVKHWPKEAMDGGKESFELIVLSNYRVEERVPYLGETRARIGDATWKGLDRATVEALVGGKV